MLCYHAQTYEQLEIPAEQLAMWAQTGNPKAAVYIPVPAKPSENAVWSAGTWVIPAPVVPESVTARQIRLWLIQHGYSLAAVDAAIDAIADQAQRDIVRVEWEYAPYVERAHPMLLPLAAALGLSPAQVDQAFSEAVIL